MSGESEPVRVAEALGDRECLGRDRCGALEVTGGLVSEHERHEQVAALDRVAGLLLKQALRAADPGAARADLSSCEKDQPAPHGATHGAQWLASFEIGVVPA